MGTMQMELAKAMVGTPLPQQGKLFNSTSRQDRKEKREELVKALKALGLMYRIEERGEMITVKIWWSC